MTSLKTEILSLISCNNCYSKIYQDISAHMPVYIFLFCFIRARYCDQITQKKNYKITPTQTQKTTNLPTSPAPRGPPPPPKKFQNVNFLKVVFKIHFKLF